MMRSGTARLHARPAGPGHAYRGAKCALAALLSIAGIVRCPCGGWEAVVVGGAAGTALYSLLARRPPSWCARLLSRPGAWSVLLSATADEVLWRGWLAGPTIKPSVVPYAAGISIVGFALVHLPRQGLRGLTTHLLTGAVFAAGAITMGLWAAITAHLSYNLWTMMARIFPDARA